MSRAFSKGEYDLREPRAASRRDAATLNRERGRGRPVNQTREPLLSSASVISGRRRGEPARARRLPATRLTIPTRRRRSLRSLVRSFARHRIGIAEQRRNLCPTAEQNGVSTLTNRRASLQISRHPPRLTNPRDAYRDRRCCSPSFVETAPYTVDPCSWGRDSCRFEFASGHLSRISSDIPTMLTTTTILRSL